MALVDGCVGLKELDLFGCKNVTKDVVSALSEIFKKDPSREKSTLSVKVGGFPSCMWFKYYQKNRYSLAVTYIVHFKIMTDMMKIFIQ